MSRTRESLRGAFECLLDIHAWMQDAQDEDAAPALDVEGDVLSYRKGTQTGREYLAPAPKVRRETKLLEREVELFTTALRRCRSASSIKLIILNVSVSDGSPWTFERGSEERLERCAVALHCCLHGLGKFRRTRPREPG